MQPGEKKTVSIQIRIPPNYFIYQEKTKLSFLEEKEVRVQNIEYPSSHLREDPFFKKKISIFEGDVSIDVTLFAPQEMKAGEQTLEAVLKFQGCSDVLCYPEETHLLSFPVSLQGGNVAASSPSRIEEGAAQTFSWKHLIQAQNFDEILKEGLGIVFIVVFLGGFLTSLTPCVLPVIPITLIIIGVRAESPLKRNFFLSSALALGISVTYALLGVVAVFFGKGLGFVFQEKWFVILLALLFFLLSLSMFGFYEIHLPQRLRQRLNQIKGHGLWGAFVSGGVAGVLAAPCAGPVIGALLLFVATTQNYFQGFWLLFIYGLGMGGLFIVLGTGYGTLQGRFRGGKFTIWMKRFLGFLLLLGSLFYLNTVVPLERGLTYLLRGPNPVSWVNSETQGLKIAKEENKVMLVDFYADWCPPCKELDHGFFRKPEVVALLKEMVPVKIDATFRDSPEIEGLLKKYNVIGWPTIKFVSPDGQILEDLSVISYNPTLLLENMQKALGTR